MIEQQWQQQSSPQGQGEGAVERIREEGHKQADHARHQITEFARRHQERWSHKLETLEHALHHTADTLRQEDGYPIADYADRAADGLGRLSHTLRESPPERLVADLEDYARRQPGVALGVAIGAGLVIGRFLRSVRTTHGSPAGQGAAGEAGTSPPTTGATEGTSGAEGAASQAAGWPDAAPRAGASEGDVLAPSSGPDVGQDNADVAE